MRKFGVRFISVLSILILVFLSACTGSKETSSPSTENGEEKQASSGDSIVIGISNAVGAINPINVRDSAAIQIASILFDPLLDVNENMEFLPKLAESFETEDNQTFTIKIHPKANWTDGKPVTSEDIKFTLETMANPKVQSLGIKTLNMIVGLTENGTLPEGETSIKGIEIVDEKTVKIHTKQPVDPNYLKEYLGYRSRIIPSHILKDKELATLHQDPFMLKPNVTSGAYTLKDFSPESHVELKANPDYYLGAPKTEKLFFKVLPSANLTAQLQTGEVHMNFPAVGAIAVQDYEKVKNMANIRTVEGKPFDYQMLYFNVKTIDDQKVRQAIVHAINRPQIVEKLLKEKAEIVDGAFTPPHLYLNKKIKNYEYDPEKAKKLLEESDWDMSKPIKLNVPVGNQVREQAAVIISENLRAVGLNVQIQKFDFPTHMQKGQKQEFDLMFLGLKYLIDPDVSIYYSSTAAYNFAGYNNSTIDQLLAQGKLEANAEKRRVIYDEIQEILHEELPTITLYADYKMGAVSKKVKVGEPKEFGMFYNVHEWVIEK
nr:ABC transporter substrate-binding protein [Neobacillus sp. Marseille-Q6967]